MIDKPAMIRKLDELLQSNYYNEPHELLWAVREFADRLSATERELLREVLLERLDREPNVATLVICTAMDLPESCPRLRRLLANESTTSQVSRLLMRMLATYPGDDNYRAVERFLDSEQQGEALRLLAGMDFRRTFSHLKRALARDHLRDVCLHIFYDHRKRVGLQTLCDDLRRLAAGEGEVLRRRIREALTAKQGAHHPFEAGDVEVALRALEERDQ